MDSVPAWEADTCLSFGCFIRDCIEIDPTADYGLTGDQLYGVYVSWCHLRLQTPQPCDSFWDALWVLLPRGERGAHDPACWPGLRMTGPAAVDYILASRPAL
jgi:hypothetical protein